MVYYIIVLAQLSDEYLLRDIAVNKTRRLDVARRATDTVGSLFCRQSTQLTALGHGHERVLAGFRLWDANACPRVFKKCRSELTKTRHIKRKIHFFSGSSPLPRLLPRGSHSSPKQAFWIDLCAELAAGHFFSDTTRPGVPVTRPDPRYR